MMLPLPHVAVRSEPISAALLAPSRMMVGVPTALTLRIRNHSSIPMTLFIEMDHPAATTWLESQGSGSTGGTVTTAAPATPEAGAGAASHNPTGIAPAAAAAAAALRPAATPVVPAPAPTTSDARTGRADGGSASDERTSRRPQLQLLVASSPGAAAGGEPPRLVLHLAPAPSPDSLSLVTWQIVAPMPGAYRLPTFTAHAVAVDLVSTLQGASGAHGGSVSARGGGGTAQALAALASTLSHTPPTIATSLALPLTHAGYRKDADALLRSVDVLLTPAVSAVAVTASAAAGSREGMWAHLLATKRTQLLRQPPVLCLDSSVLGTLVAVADEA